MPQEPRTSSQAKLDLNFLNVNAAAVTSLGYAACGIAYLAIVSASLISPVPWDTATTIALTAIVCLLAWVGWIWFQFQPPSPDNAHPLLFSMLMLMSIQTGTVLFIIADPIHSGNQILVALAAAFFLHARPWFYSALLVLFCCWIPAAVPGLKSEDSADWDQWIRLIMAGFGLSVGIFEARRRSVVRIYLLNQAAEQALARAEEANTGRLSMERMMQEAQRRESLGVLAGGIAHDFNNFLTIIRGNVDLLRLGLAPNSEQLELLSEIDEASARSVDLTQKILVYTGRSNPEVAMLDLVEEVRSSARLMESSVPLSVKLITELSPTPIPIHGDATLIDQLVINLIQNAFDACRAKGGVVRVVCALETLDAVAIAQFGFQEPPTESLYATLLISDNGTGIDNEVLQRVFEPFYSTKSEGHGLGLAVVRGIVETHAAGVRVTSEPSGLTVFKVAFPKTSPVVAVQRSPDANGA